MNGANASGAKVWAAIDETGEASPMTDPDSLTWKLIGAYGKTKITLSFPSNLRPGTRVWICASWYNAHGEGSRCEPISTHIAGGAMTPWVQGLAA